MARATWTGEPRSRPTERGFTLAAVLVIMAVMAIFLTVAVETASFQARREKEAELIFRGDQIVEAIRLFRARNGRFPGGLKELVAADPRVLRKVWKDPVTGKADWVPVFLGQEGSKVKPGEGSGDRSPQREVPPTPTPGPNGPAFPPTDATGPVVGVHSRSCAQSIKLLDGRDRYCDWNFVFDPNKQKPGQTVPKPGGG